jgi:hypothetical protein
MANTHGQEASGFADGELSHPDHQATGPTLHLTRARGTGREGGETKAAKQRPHAAVIRHASQPSRVGYRVAGRDCWCWWSVVVVYMTQLPLGLMGFSEKTSFRVCIP